MKKEPGSSKRKGSFSRRTFLGAGGAAIAGSALTSSPVLGMTGGRSGRQSQSTIKGVKTLGRTGFEVSDLSVGGVPLDDPAVVRFAYDAGMNYYDLGESYGGGAAEQAVGDVMQYMDRSKIFITTKLGIRNDTEETILDRFGQCLGRLQTEYVDALYIHGVGSIEALKSPAFHSAFDRLKADGKVRFRGISCHGPGRGSPDSQEEILLGAVEDGRFDQMLFTFNFLSQEMGDRVLAACKEKNIGTTAMKTKAGALKPTPFDPENPTEQQTQSIERSVSRGRTREQAVQAIQNQIQRQEESYQQSIPFMEKYGVTTQDELDIACVQWVVQNPDMHTACIGAFDIDTLDKYMHLSGSTSADMELLHDYAQVIGDRYCRHGCTECSGACPFDLPVSTIMRYAYYFECQGREKDAMLQYAALDGGDASLCLGCEAPCNGACPYGLDIQANMLEAHSRLTL